MSHVSRLLEPAVVERLNQLQVSARRVVEGNTAGLHRSALKGSSITFRGNRPYVPGDEPRRLDWRLLARTDRPYVREYDEETNLRCLILLDRSGSMGYGRSGNTKFDFAARLVAGLAYLMLGQGEAVGLSLAGSKPQTWISPTSHGSQLSRLVDVLEQTSPAGMTDLQRAINNVADRLDRRSLIVIVSDLFLPSDHFRDGIARLKHDRHETIVFRVLDRDEVDFPFARFARFHGLESESSRVIDASLARQQYLESFRRHRESLDEVIRSARIDSATLLTESRMIDALTAFLRRRAGR